MVSRTLSFTFLFRSPIGIGLVLSVSLSLSLSLSPRLNSLFIQFTVCEHTLAQTKLSNWVQGAMGPCATACRTKERNRFFILLSFLCVVAWLVGIGTQRRGPRTRKKEKKKECGVCTTQSFGLSCLAMSWCVLVFLSFLMLTQERKKMPRECFSSETERTGPW